MADDFDEMVTWRGKRIDDMTREELIEALRVMGNLYRAQFDHVARMRSMKVAPNG